MCQNPILKIFIDEFEGFKSTLSFLYDNLSVFQNLPIKGFFESRQFLLIYDLCVSTNLGKFLIELFNNLKVKIFEHQR